MTPKESLKVGLLFLGIFLIVAGLAAIIPKNRDASHSHTKGEFAAALSIGAFSSYAPWMIAAGGTALIGGYLLREK